MALSDFYNGGSLNTQWGCSSYDISPTTLQNNVLGFARSHSLSPGQTVNYYFDYTPVGQTYQDETGTYTFTD